MNRKFRVMVGFLGMLLLLCVFNVPALTQDYCFKTVANITGSTNTETNNPAVHLIDDNPGTFWKLAPGSTQGWVEVHLSSNTVIHGLKIFGELADDTELAVEYLQGEQWIRFLAGIYKTIPLNGVIDLSYDRAVTGRLRLCVTGTGVVNTHLSEIKIIGEEADAIFHRINPRRISASGHTSHLTREKFLIDGNTYTYWMVKPRYRSGNNWLFETLEGYLGIKPDYNYNFNWPNCPSYYNRGEVVFEMAATEKINNINIFFTGDTRGDVTIESEASGTWKKIGFIPERHQPGWYRTAFEPAVVSSKIRLVMEGTGHECVGGISEVEFWGYGNYHGDSHTNLGPQTAQSLNTAINRQFILKKEDSQNHRLNFAVTGDGQLKQTLPVDLNGTEYSAAKSAELNGHTIYSLKLTEAMLDDDCNYLRIKPLAGYLDGLKLTSGEDGVQRHQALDLNDGLLLISGKNLSEQIINLGQKVLVEQVEVYTTEAADLNLSYWDGERWAQVNAQPANTPGWVRFKAVITTDQLKISNPSQISLYEVRVLGSAVTDHAPAVRLIRPEDYEVYDTDQLSDKYLIGFVDNPRAKVKVNGKDVFQIGHYFGFHLTAVGARTWEDTVVEAVAVDPEGRIGRYQTHMIIDKLPWLTLDQPDKVAFSGEATYQISGEVNKPNCTVKVNGQTVTDKKGRFATSVGLEEGFNRIKIECIYQKPGNGGGTPKKDEYTQTFYRKVVRYSGKVELQINSPLDGSWISANNVTVSGYVFGLGALKVWVNGKPAPVEGEGFQLTTSLAEGKNSINIKVQDARGVSASQSLIVWRDTLSPKIIITQPSNQAISNSATVPVSGTVTDAFTACVTVNGTTAGIAGDKFSAEITLTEGWNPVTVKAWDAAGNGSQETIQVLVDTEPPLPFETKADPGDWTNDTRPVLTFGTTDATSGISHYLLAIDGGAFAKVTSPYRIPPQEDGEHAIVVKAVDKAGWETESTAKVYIDTTPPVVVPGFKAVPGDKKIIVSWKLNPETDVVKYIVKRNPAFPDGPQKEFGPEVTVYTDKDVQNLSSYTYSIHAVDHADNAGPVKTTPTVKAGLTEVTVNPNEETAIEYENVLMVIPQGALKESKTLTVLELQPEQAQPLIDNSYAINISPVYSFSARTSSGPVDPNGVKFEKPVLVGINFKLEGALQLLKKDCLKAYYYDYKAQNWEMIPESFVDGEKNVVYFMTNHFSMFSVQASVAPAMGPEQISNMGISPGKGYHETNQVSVSYGSGSANVMSKDFVLPGRGGLDLTISRSYDSILAQSDWGIEQENLFQTLCDFGSSLFGQYYAIFANIVAQKIDQYLSKPAGSFGFGRGWRMDLVWVEKDENGQFIHLPGGAMKKINWNMTGSGWGDQGQGRFECHAGEHFILEQTQAFQENIYFDDPASGTPIKVGERWITDGFTLTTRDGTKYYMSSDGKLQQVVNRLKTSEIKFNYRSDGKLDHIIDSVGRRIQFSYSGKFISTISGAGKTVNYSYNDLQELETVNEGGIHQTRYGYVKHTLESGAQTFNLASMVMNFYTGNWVGLISSLLPSQREDDVYYLSSVKTPFSGEYRIIYSKYDAKRYSSVFGGYSVIWYEFCKVSKLAEVDLVTDKVLKETSIEYQIAYINEQSPTVGTCTVYEGKKKTHMLFDLYSNSVDKNTGHIKLQTVYGEQDRVISAHLVEEFDYELEAPTKVIDQTGGRGTVTEFEYDNWGNVVWQKNSHTKVEAFYSYANATTDKINYPAKMNSIYGDQSISGEIHDAKTGEYILNYNGTASISQQTYYKYGSNGNLLEKAIKNEDTWLRTGYQYDSFGNITKITSSSGIETFYEHSDEYKNALLTKVTLSRITDADGAVRNNLVLKELGYDPITYRERWEKDARGFVTQFSQDVLGRELMTVHPDDNDPEDFRPDSSSGPIDRSGFRSDNPVQQVIYDDPARLTTIIDPMGNRTDYLYDGLQHLIEIVKFKKVLGVPYAYSRVKVRYDDQGNIHEIINPEGSKNPSEEFKYKTIYLYDEANRLIKTIYPDTTKDQIDNPFKYYSYNDVTNEVTVTDENGHDTVIKKDAVDRVIEQIAGWRSDCPVTTRFEYDSLGNKISETDGKGNVTSYDYDDQNRLIRKTLPQVEVLNDPIGSTATKSPVSTYIYDNEGNLIREVSPLGTAVKHYYDELNREIKTETHVTGLDGSKKTVISKTFYDLSGNKVKTIDPQGKNIEFSYTARGWLKEQKDPTGGTIRFTYDAVGNKLSVIDPRGNVTNATANSYTAWYYYDELYRVVKAVLPDGTPPTDPKNPGDNPVVTYDYDLNGNCIIETKANGQAIDYTYNGRNWLLTQSQTLGGTTYTTRFEYDGVGNKKYMYNNKGNKTEFRYDALNRLALQISPEGNTVGYDYDANGNKTIVTDGEHNETKYEYDALNRLKYVKNVIDGKEIATENWYDEEGRLTKTKSSTGLVTTFQLNEMGLPLRVVDSLGQIHSCDYDITGNTIYKRDPRGTETRFEYDDLYRVLRADLKNGTRQQYLSYEYDLVGNIKQTGNGQVELIYNNADTNFDSDPFNRVKKVAQVMPGGVTYNTEYRYDQMGQMTGIRYPNSSQWLTYDYDKMGRLTAIPGFAGTKSNPGFGYDKNNAIMMIKTDNGITTTIPDIGGRDENGRVKLMTVTKSSGEEMIHLTYDYDKANNVTERNDNLYVYDELNRLERATIFGAFEDKFTKADLKMGKVDQDYHGEKEAEEDVTDQTQIKLDFSARSLILDLQTEADNVSKVELTPAQTGHRVPVEQIEIYYRNGFSFNKLERDKWVGMKDEKGKIIIKFVPLLRTGELKIHCNYDDLDYFQLPVDRSEFANSPEKLVTVYQKFATRTESYEYDAMGNRDFERIKLRKEYEYDYIYYPNSNRLQSKIKLDGTERVDYEYDANGNMTVKVVTKGEEVDRWEYSYDLLNQLEQVKKNGAIISSYIYDPNGFRVEKTGSKGKIHYIPLLNGEVGYRKEFSTNTEYSFIYVRGQHFARVNGVIGGNGKKFFYHNDHLGSALAITDENGNKVVDRDFTPFGERINTDVYDDEPRDMEEDDSGFTGKDWDEDVELYYYNARWYDAGIGRFISEDPIIDDPTLYSYGFNNPLVNIDPSGLFNINLTYISNAFNTFMRNVAPFMNNVQKVINTWDRISTFVKDVVKIVDPDNTEISEKIDEINAEIEPVRTGIVRWKQLVSVRYLESAAKMYNELGKLGYSHTDRLRFLASYYDNELDKKIPDQSKEDVYNKIANSNSDGKKIVAELKEGFEMGASASSEIVSFRNKIKDAFKDWDNFVEDRTKLKNEWNKFRSLPIKEIVERAGKGALGVGILYAAYEHNPEESEKIIDDIENYKKIYDQYSLLYDQYKKDYEQLRILVNKHPAIAVTIASFYVRNKDQHTQSYVNALRSVVLNVNSGIENVFGY